ncbi:MAG: alpha-galactosidase [Kiritimatiellales bacterium]|nr:alpha-galactosidase [Kiritimatiellales bacterium]
MKRVIVLLVATAFSFSSWAGSRADTGWKGMAVDVQGEHVDQLALVKKFSSGKSGFTRLDIKITNAGAETVRIDSIAVTVPLMEQVSGDMDILFGGNSMGRDPVQRAKAADPLVKPGDDKGIRSSLFEMIRLADDQYVFAGSLSWRTFLPLFHYQDNAFVIRADGERRLLQPGEQLHFEKIVFARGDCWQELLDEFGDAIARENGIWRLKDEEFKGWATWDYYGRIFTDKDVFGNMDALNKFAPDANLIQIDGGWWTERGDYTSIRDGLDGGIKALAGRIASDGKTPGLHFDGFRGDAASEICKTHPEYFLHDQDGNLIVDYNQKPDKLMKYTFFDYSHPGARAHIAECVRTMKEDWGIRYFKVDFMRYGLQYDILKNVNKKKKTVDHIVAHDPSLTSVERFRLGMETIREAIGENNYFLGCSAVFGPCIGFVDGMRTGGDVHPRYDAFPQRCLANAGNYYLARKVYNGDADYLVFRAAEDEDATIFKSNNKFGGTMTLNEAQTWADFNVMYGNCRLQSDNLMTLRQERKDIVRYVFDCPAMDQTVPLDMWKHATDKDDGFELLLSREGKNIFLGIFNWGDEKKKHIVSGFDGKAVFETKDGKTVSTKTGFLAVTLNGRSSVVLKYDGKQSFDELRKAIQSN